MERWKGRVALVTGASSGIGAGIARALVKHGVKVAVCARNVQRLKDLKEELKTEPGDVLPIQCDLQKEDDILAMFQTIKETLGGVDICINNAGVCLVSPLMSGSTELWRQQMAVNVMAPCICTREALALMKENNVDDGHIIHIGSTAGRRVATRNYHNFYSGMKHMLVSFTEALRRELIEKQSHIRVTVINPGVTRTGIFQSMAFEDNAERAIFLESITTIANMEVDDVAAAVIYALGAPPHVQVHDILLRPVGQPR